MWRTVLEQFHFNHSVTNRMKSIARVCAHWSGMAKDIKGLIKYSLKGQLTAIGLLREIPVPWPEI